MIPTPAHIKREIVSMYDMKKESSDAASQEKITT
jgi:hypothetical protein